MKEMYKSLADKFGALHTQFSGTKVDEEIQHVLDSLFFADTADNELEGAVAVSNAVEMFYTGSHYEHIAEKDPELTAIIKEAETKLDDYIQPHLKEGYLDFEDVICEQCEADYGFYMFGREKDKLINNGAVYELMYLSRLCDSCWQNKYWSPEE